MTEQTELLREIRDLLQVMAEPALEKRDERLRNSLREIVGKSKPKAKAILLFDGSKTANAIAKDAGVDSGNMSRLMKELRGSSLIGKDDKNPKLVIVIPPNFFNGMEEK